VADPALGSLYAACFIRELLMNSAATVIKIFTGGDYNDVSG
jgi:hypothetical protein